jgi:ribulose-5-phosphate 4-epimerase/fuculose-1-phosphate aldolase
MFLRNHGVVCCGRSIEEAWLMTYHTVLACDTQLKMMPFGLDNLVLIGKTFFCRLRFSLHKYLFLTQEVTYDIQ